MAEKIFYENPYLFSLRAKVRKVESAEPQGGAREKVFLDRTVVFAFSGGQESDSAEINGKQMLAAESEGEEIAHIFPAGSFFSGQEVEIRIDGEKRLKIMRLHSAAHIVYELFSEKINQRLSLIGSNITSDKGRMDFSFNRPASEFVPWLQKELNEAVSSDFQILSYEDEKEAGKRWWEIREKCWKMPCGGLHPKRTGELGKLALKRRNIGAGKERIEISLA